jgi:cytochrome c peroxidase
MSRAEPRSKARPTHATPATLLVVAGAAVLGACETSPSLRQDSPPSASTSTIAEAHIDLTEEVSEIDPRLLRRYAPLRASFHKESGPAYELRVALGGKLFRDPRLSRGGDISCNGCHDLADYGVDHRPVSRGHRGQLGRRNAPTVYNAAGLFAQFWDGRAEDLEIQAMMPMLSENEMAMPSPFAVVAAVREVPEYRELFKRAFPQDALPVTFVHVAEAIAAFERGLRTPSRWDRYLSGDRSALSQDELRGFRIFSQVGCVDCHTGEMLGGSSFHRTGHVKPWPNQTDQGRYEITKDDKDRMMFRVPSLRNVETTSPYFHDGSAATLEQAVSLMGVHQLGYELSKPEVEGIVAWLRSLTGDVPKGMVPEDQAP